MNYLAALELLLKWGPTAVAMGQKIIAAIKAGRGNQEVTDADWVELARLNTLSAEAIYARLGIELPPPATLAAAAAKPPASPPQGVVTLPGTSPVTLPVTPSP